MITNDTASWLDRLLPLPKEIEIPGSLRIPAGQIGVRSAAGAEPALRTALRLLRAFATGDPQNAAFTIELALPGQGVYGIAEEVKERLQGLPNREQAYAILPQGEKGLLLLANTAQGLLFAARTLAQLVRVPQAPTPSTAIELPLARVIDWPDLTERGQWGGNAQYDLPATAQWEMNVLEIWCETTVDGDGRPVVNLRRDLFQQGAELGVKIVPYILHLEQVSRYAGLLSRQELLSTPNPAKPLPSDYVPGLCMSSQATEDLVAEWLARAAEIDGVTDIMVWLSEDAAPCYCPQCLGQEPFGLEVQCIVRAFRGVQKSHPQARLRLLTTQGSYPVNDKVIAATPEDVGITYYDGGRTYDSSHKPMIYPLLEEYARAGRWLGVYPQITHCWRTVFPWTAPQFLQYRAQEFVDKQLSCMIGYAVPSNHYHRFNVAAEAEWTWNAQGRTPAEFARAYATVTGIAEPDLFARWALKAGAAGWVLAESRLLLTLIYNPALGLTTRAPLDHRFEMASLLPVESLNEALTAAREALALAQESCVADLLDESEAVLAGLEVFSALRTAVPLLRASSLADAERGQLAAALEELDRCALVLQTHLFAWAERIHLRTGERPFTRVSDTANVLLRTCDALRELAGRLGMPDPHPKRRLKRLAEWSAQDFGHGQHTALVLDLAGIASTEGGAYDVGFDYIDSAYGTDVERVAILAKRPGETSYAVIAETPDMLKRVSIWERWAEVRLTIPATAQGTQLALEVGLAGFPPDAPEGRRTSSGAVGIRRIG